MIRFGKSSGALLAHKKSFFEDNERLLKEGQRIAKTYVEQPRRTVCKCCAGPLGEVSFTKHGIDYHLCARCGHLNGAHEDTDAFCDSMYVEDSGKDYAKNYDSSDRDAYDQRVQDIYLPKAEFLRDALTEKGIDSSALTFADFGAGSGYFVSAMRKLGWTNATGYEVSKTQVQLAEAMIEPGAVRRHDLGETATLAGSVECDLVSMIGVLEHLQKPREFLKAIQDNRRIQYFYISVPLFSPCVFFEMVFPHVFQRQLSAGHTHLFTEESLEWMRREFSLKRIAEWWFGTDFVDLFRSVAVEMERHPQTVTAVEDWSGIFASAIDDLQIALDKRKLSSEVHMLFEFDR